MIRNLDRLCGACARPAGDHTLREWDVCMGTVTTDLSYEDVPDDIAAAVRERFGLDDDVVIADHVVVRSATLDGATGQITVKVPLLIHEFSVGLPGSAPRTVAKIAFVGNANSMRAYGRLARDSANGAANAAER